MDGYIEIAKFAICSLCFIVHVVECKITIAKAFVVVTKTTMLSSIDECNHNWMMLPKFGNIFKVDSISKLLNLIGVLTYYLTWHVVLT